jgi:hypothetical protein
VKGKHVSFCTSEMMKENIRKRKQTKGQGIIEFALLLPLLILIIVGVFDLGRAFFGLITITNTAREMARQYVLSYPDPIPITTYNSILQDAQDSGINVQSGDVSITCPDGCGIGKAVRVTVNYSMPLIIGWVLPNNLNMSRSIDMLVP